MICTTLDSILERTFHWGWGRTLTSYDYHSILVRSHGGKKGEWVAGGVLFLCKNQGKPGGSGGTGSWMHIVAIAVDYPFQRRFGMGSWLLRELKKYADRDNIPHITVDADRSSVGFFLNNGFTEMEAVSKQLGKRAKIVPMYLSIHENEAGRVGLLSRRSQRLLFKDWNERINASNKLKAERLEAEREFRKRVRTGEKTCPSGQGPLSAIEPNTAYKNPFLAESPPPTTD